MTKAKTQAAAQLEPQVGLCHTNPHTFLIELQRLILAGYRLDLDQMTALIPSCYIANLALPEQ